MTQAICSAEVESAVLFQGIGGAPLPPGGVLAAGLSSWGAFAVPCGTCCIGGAGRGLCSLGIEEAWEGVSAVRAVGPTPLPGVGDGPFKGSRAPPRKHTCVAPERPGAPNCDLWPFCLEPGAVLPSFHFGHRNRGVVLGTARCQGSSAHQGRGTM